MKEIRKMVLFFMIIFCGIILINVSLSGTECSSCFSGGQAWQVCQGWCQVMFSEDCDDIGDPQNCHCVSGDDCSCQFWVYCEDEHSGLKSKTFTPCGICAGK